MKDQTFSQLVNSVVTSPGYARTVVKQTAAGTTSITISGLDLHTANCYHIIVYAINGSGIGDNIAAQLNGDSGSNYASNTGSVIDNDTKIILSTPTPRIEVALDIKLFGDLSIRPILTGTSVGTNNDKGRYATTNCFGTWDNTSNVTSITFKSAMGVETFDWTVWVMQAN